ncbi:hypothetical protein ANCDUO_09292 [Ancylostoma duodenale]|uniref:C3H1-type domain-containing protein n=1 Tax=Ancylostoma duodenale TaxID=51022 RepID=A0A0C2GH05_9BILA|nr:hypothetical protein ANCDUO_09292 [Ancylostoma duodenale]
MGFIATLFSGIVTPLQMYGKMANMDRMSGAEYLASIYGTEKDKISMEDAATLSCFTISEHQLGKRVEVNCSFFFKIGACRHGDKCSRTHIIPTFSQTVLLKNLYHNPVIDMRQADACTKILKRWFSLSVLDSK